MFMGENMGKRKWKIIKGYQAHSAAGGDRVQPLEKEKRKKLILFHSVLQRTAKDTSQNG